MIAIGCYGTAVNTDQHEGIIKQFEEELKRLVYWFICLLNCNELPLRHLIHEVDGKVSGPSNLTGPIGKQLLKLFSHLKLIQVKDRF